MGKIKKFLDNGEKRKEFSSELLWILRRSNKYRLFIVIYTFLGLFGVALSFVSGIASKYLIDAVTAQKKSMLLSAFAVFASMGIFSLVFSAFSQRLQIRINIKVTNELRAEIFDAILKSRWESITAVHSGDILNRLSSDIPSVVKFLLDCIPGLITKCFRFFGAFWIIFYYDKVLSLIALLGAPVIVISSRFLITRMRAFNKKTKEISSELMAFTEEATQSLTFIKSFSLSSLFLSKYNGLQNKQRDTLLDYNKFSVFTTTMISFTGLLVSFASYGWGVYRLWTGNISYGTMVLFLQLAGGLTSAFSALVGIVPEAVSAATGAGRLMQLYDLPREENDGTQLNKSVLPPDISFHNVSFHYKNGSDVLKETSFSVPPGETVAFVGPSGSGKTTVLRLLLGLVTPQSGHITVTDANGVQNVSAATRGWFSYVSQENMFFSGTVAENMRNVRPDASDGEIAAALKTAAADFVFDLPDGINSHINRATGGFSHGQLQRLSIARALLCDAPVMLLDEATSALDIDTEQRIIRNIFSSGFRKTCIITTHRESMLTVCSSVYKVENNRITKIK